MAGFTDGFNSGLNLMFSAKRLGLYEDELELRRKNLDRQDQPISEVAPAVATDLNMSGDTTFGEAQDILNIKKTSADIDATIARTDYTKSQTDLINIELDPERIKRRDIESDLIIAERELRNEKSELDNIALQKQYNNSVEYEDAILTENLANSLFVLVNDPEFMATRGTPSYDLAISNLADIYGRASEGGRTDIAKIFAPEMVQARATIQPIIQAFRSENPEAIGEVNFGDYNTELNTFFDVKKGQYIGKNFKKADGTTSKVKNVEIDFDSIEATGNGNAILLKGNFELEDGTIVSSYMPDSAAATITASNKSTDAVSVSLTDMIDITASIDSILGTALENPNNSSVFQLMGEIATRNKEMIERGDVSTLVKINVEATKELDRQTDGFREIWVTSNAQNIARNIDRGDPTRESDAIRTLTTQFNFTADVDVLNAEEAVEAGIDITKNPEGPFYRYKRNEDGSLVKSPLRSAIDQNIMSFDEIVTGLKRGTSFEDIAPTAPTLSTGFIFSKLSDPIARGDTLSNALPKIKEAYPTVDVDGYVAQVRKLYADRYPDAGPLSDDAILELLTRNPLLR
jgi:hypothetical protein